MLMAQQRLNFSRLLSAKPLNTEPGNLRFLLFASD
jgi:hypothetical protein